MLTALLNDRNLSNKIRHRLKIFDNQKITIINIILNSFILKISVNGHCWWINEKNVHFINTNLCTRSFYFWNCARNHSLRLLDVKKKRKEIASYGIISVNLLTLFILNGKILIITCKRRSKVNPLVIGFTFKHLGERELCELLWINNN